MFVFKSDKLWVEARFSHSYMRRPALQIRRRNNLGLSIIAPVKKAIDKTNVVCIMPFHDVPDTHVVSSVRINFPKPVYFHIHLLHPFSISLYYRRIKPQQSVLERIIKSEKMPRGRNTDVLEAVISE